MFCISLETETKSVRVVGMDKSSDIFCRRLHNTQNICYGNNDIFRLLLPFMYTHFSHIQSSFALLVHFLLRLDQNQNLHKLFPSIKFHFPTTTIPYRVYRIENESFSLKLTMLCVFNTLVPILDSFEKKKMCAQISIKRREKRELFATFKIEENSKKIEKIGFSFFPQSFFFIFSPFILFLT